MTTYKMFHNQRDFKKNWISFSTDQPLEQWLMKYVQEEFWIWDSDCCGEEELEFVITDENHQNPQFFKIGHEWWWSTETDDDGDHCYLANDFELFPNVTSVSFRYPTRDRDWLKLDTYAKFPQELLTGTAPVV